MQAGDTAGCRFLAVFRRILGSPFREVGSCSGRAALAAVAALALAPSWLGAATTISVTPIAWDIIGLDSNNVTVGPNHFPIGARVCNTGAAVATNVQASYLWDSANPLINLRPGTLSSITVPSLSIGACTDFYFEVEVTRNAAAYDTVRRYHIAVTADAGATTGSTPVPRQVYIEHLISQSRNSVLDMQVRPSGVGAFTSVAAGGSMTLLVGQTYDIKLVAATATQGYEQIETFINFPNIIFQVLGVATTYTAESSPTLNPPYDKLYGDACVWDANPLSPNYRSCLSTGKAGGNVTVTYTVKILAVPGSPLLNPEPLSTLIHDFSGSSYHYNADYGVTTRFAYILDPTTLTLSKSFVASTIAPAATSTLTIRIPNPTPGPLTGVNFTDPLPTSPAAMVVAATPSASTSGCGTPTFAPAPGATSLSFSGATIPANSTCVINVNVTAPSTGSYTNTTNHLFINGTTPGTGIDTGNSASAVLTVANNAVACAAGQTMARWTVPVGSTNPPDTTGGVAGFRASNVSTATVSASQPANTAIVAGAAGQTNAWSTYGYKTAPTQSLSFVVQTKNYSTVTMTWDWINPSPANGPTTGTVSSNLGGSVTITPGGATWAAGPLIGGLTTSTTGNTTFTLNMTGAKNDNGGASIDFDNITFTGCSFTPPPNISKSFATDPIVVGGTPSLLTFTVRNNTVTSPVYDPVALADVNFSDTLPTGLRVRRDGTYPASTTCTSTSGAALALTAVNGTTLISLTGAELAAAGSCTVSVYVEGTVAGSYLNVSGFVSGFVGATQFTNTGANGFATAPITVISPPVIAKSFGAATILTGGSTSLSFTITNPNVGTALTGVAFTDSLPAGLVVATPNGLSGSCGGGTITATAGSGSVSLSGASLSALAACTFSLNVRGATAGTKNNSVTVTSTNAGTGNTALASLVVKNVTPAISLLKQVGPSATGAWTSFLSRAVGAPVYYQLTIENVGDVALSPVSVTDPLVDLSSCTWPAALAAGGTAGDTATCVVGPVTAVAGSHPNTATASGTYSGTTVTDTSTATYSTNGLTLVKAAQELVFTAAGEVLNYSYGVTNTGNVALANPVVVSDDKSTTESCPNTNTVGNNDGFLDPGESIVCTATYTTVAADVTAGQVTNIASATADSVMSNSDTAIVPLAGAIDLEVTKTDGVAKLESGSSTTYTIVVSNNGPSVDAATLSDPAVAGLNKTSVGICSSFGGATCPTVGPGAGNLNITNLENGTVSIPSLPNGGGITFTVVATVTATSPPVTNTVTVSKVSGVLTEFDSANNTASDTDTLALNFGHLPSVYVGMNLLASGGAHTLSGSTFLGAGKTTADDGINTPTYTVKATDDGVTWTPNVSWTVATGASVDVTVTCPSAPCYLNAWIDWNADSDFADSGEQIFTNQAVSGGLNTLTFSIPSGALLDGTTLYSRFRLSNQPMTTPSPAGQALNGGTPLIGEIEDPFFQVKDGVTTPVTVASFVATPEGRYGVQLEWTTASETGNVGFNLYVRRGGKLERLNNELIPSHTIDSLERQTYSFRGEVEGGDVFFVEDVSVLGHARRHGPFRSGRTYGSRVDGERIPWAAIRRQMDAQTAVRKAALPAASLELWLEVRHSGIHRVTWEALRAAGLDLRGPLDKVLVSYRGEPVPYFLSSKQPAPGAYLEFYGEASSSPYTDTNVYVLSLRRNSAQPGISEAPSPPSLVSAPAPGYSETFTLDRQRAYANYTPGADPWYDTAMLTFTTPATWQFPFQLDGLADPAAPAALELTAWGVTNWPESPDHHLVASLNGTPVVDQVFDGLTEKVWRVELPAGTLRDGPNLLQLTLPGDTGVRFDLVNFDRLRIRYQRQFRARDGRITFTARGPDFQVTGLASPDVVVYRFGADGPRRLTGVRVESSGDGFAASFSGPSTTATYVVSTVAALHLPGVEPARTPVGLDLPAEYLVITHPAFTGGLWPLVQARQRQGLSVNVVEVDDLYSAYSYGVVDPQAIRDYLAYAAANLGTRAVLLVGGDTYDYRDYLGVGSISFIPSLYASTGPLARLVPADALFTDFDGDRIPDLAIGRFPVRTSAELASIVDKTLAYEGKSYPRTALFVADKRDGSISFSAINQGFIQRLAPGWSVVDVGLDSLPVASARAETIAGMNQGSALVTFTGHSGPREWTFSGLFTTDHAVALTNAGRPFVVAQWGCWNTYYVDPVSSYLVHSFLFSGDRGAAAVLGAATLTTIESERRLGELLTPRLTRRGVSLGRALLEAKQELARTSPELADVLLGWSLMGDPALVVEP